MPSEKEQLALQAVLENILLAQSFSQGMTFSEFQADRRTIYAVTRCLEIISEASRRLTPKLKDRHPNIDWVKVAGSGNIYRHGYHAV
ncbi:MAG TPA: HepT-like ribonuclease domain-containing protein, partial [Xanthobacteraceae bacterium]|nr:HepT-like ribonuclease domain-containing protein [Xanthobacteraceae bacterium]